MRVFWNLKRELFLLLWYNSTKNSTAKNFHHKPKASVKIMKVNKQSNTPTKLHITQRNILYIKSKSDNHYFYFIIVVICYTDMLIQYCLHKYPYKFIFIPTLWLIWHDICISQYNTLKIFTRFSKNIHHFFIYFFSALL